MAIIFKLKLEYFVLGLCCGCKKNCILLSSLASVSNILAIRFDILWRIHVDIEALIFCVRCSGEYKTLVNAV